MIRRNFLGALAVFMMLACAAQRVEATTVPAGEDLYTIMPGSAPASGSWIDLTSEVPQGALGFKLSGLSDAIPAGTRIFLTGNPASLADPAGPFSTLEVTAPFLGLGSNAQIQVQDARNVGGLPAVDTVVQRLAAANLPTIGSSDTVPIEITALRLSSVAPMPVTFGGSDPSFFNVIGELDGAQSQGSMTFTRTSPTGGTFEMTLPVNYRATLANTNPSDFFGVFQTQGPLSLSSTFVVTGGTWSFPFTGPVGIDLHSVGLFNTGEESYVGFDVDTGNIPAMIDHHWYIASGPVGESQTAGPEAYVLQDPPSPPWLPNAASSESVWIAGRAAAAGVSSAGQYSYRIDFDLTGFDPNAMALAGQFAVDNSAIILLNGTPTGASGGGFGEWIPFSINSGFVDGLNTLEFLITNGAVDPMGLRVEFTSLTQVPEPGGFALAAVGLIIVGSWRMRRHAR